MLQVFLLTEPGENPAFEDLTALPAANHLIPALETSGISSQKNGSHHEYLFSPARALTFLRDFYAQYELSQPQRRVRLRFEKKLSEFKTDQPVRFVVADVSAHQSRRIHKKTSQSY